MTDSAESLVGLMISTPLPLVSIYAGWVGCVRGHGRGRQWWTLAIGHVPAAACQPTVTFTRRTRDATRDAPRGRTALLLEAVDGLWVVHQGLWVAAAGGPYTHVRLTTRSTTREQRLRQVTEPAAR